MSLKQDQRFRQIKDLTPEQIDSFIENNVTDLESAKDVLKLLAKAIVANAE